MTFQKRALTPEEMEKTAGGWLSNRATFWGPEGSDKITTTLSNSPFYSWRNYSYTVFDNETNAPIAVTSFPEYAEAIDFEWNHSNEGKEVNKVIKSLVTKGIPKSTFDKGENWGWERIHFLTPAEQAQVADAYSKL